MDSCSAGPRLPTASCQVRTQVSCPRSRSHTQPVYSHRQTRCPQLSILLSCFLTHSISSLSLPARPSIRPPCNVKNNESALSFPVRHQQQHLAVSLLPDLPDILHRRPAPSPTPPPISLSAPIQTTIGLDDLPDGSTYNPNIPWEVGHLETQSFCACLSSSLPIKTRPDW